MLLDFLYDAVAAAAAAATAPSSVSSLVVLCFLCFCFYFCFGRRLIMLEPVSMLNCPGTQLQWFVY